MQLIRLSDDKFASRLMRKYGWTIGPSANRRGLLIYRTEPKFRPFASTPMHIDVHIRSIRSMLHMYTLNVNRTAQRERLIERSAALIRETLIGSNAQPQASRRSSAHISAPQRERRSEPQSAAAEQRQPASRSVQQTDDSKLHSDFTEIFQSYSIHNAHSANMYVYPVINQVNQWIRNQSWWRSITARQLVAHAYISNDGPAREAGSSPHLRQDTQSSLIRQDGWRTHAQTDEHVIVINRTSAPQLLSSRMSHMRPPGMIQRYAARQAPASERSNPQQVRQTSLSSPASSGRDQASQRREPQQIADTGRTAGQAAAAPELRARVIARQADGRAAEQVPAPDERRASAAGQALSASAGNVVGAAGEQPLGRLASAQLHTAAIAAGQPARPDQSGMLIPRSALIVRSMHRAIQSGKREAAISRSSSADSASSRDAGRTANQITIVMSQDSVLIRNRMAEWRQHADHPARRTAGDGFPINSSAAANRGSFGSDRRMRRQDGPANAITGINRRSIASPIMQIHSAQSIVPAGNAGGERTIQPGRTAMASSIRQPDAGRQASEPGAARVHVTRRTVEEARAARQALEARPLTSMQPQAQQQLAPMQQREQRIPERNAMTHRARQSDARQPDARQSEPLRADNRAPAVQQPSSGRTIIQQQVTEQRINLNQTAHQSVTHIHIDGQGTASMSGATSQTFVRRLSERTIRTVDRRTNELRLINRSELRTVQWTSRFERPPAATVIASRRAQPSHMQPPAPATFADRQEAAPLSGAAAQTFARRLTERLIRTVDRRTTGLRLTNRSELRAVQLMNRIDRLQATTVIANRRITRTELMQREGSEAIAVASVGAGAVPLVLRARRAESAGSESPLVSRTPVRTEPIRMEVPVKRVSAQADQEPIIRSLQHAIKSVEQELNEAKEQWSKPNLSVSQLADQMYKEFSRRIRHEQQRRGL